MDGRTYCSIVTHITIRNNNIDVRDDTACDGGISHNGVATIPDTDPDFVNYGVVFVLQLLFYNLQRLDLYDNGHSYDIIYDIRVFNNNNTPCSGHLYNNNGTNNDTPDYLSGVENDRSGTIRYGNNNISFTNIYDAIVMHIIYNSVAHVTVLDTISSSSGRSYVCLSSELASMPPFSSNIVRLSSDRFHLSSDCGTVHLEYFPVALVERMETIPSLASPYLSPDLKSLCSSSHVLYSYSSSSHAKCPSSISFSCLISNLIFGSSIAPITRCFTRHIYYIRFLKFDTESFLSCSYDHIHDHGVVLVSRIHSYYSQISIYHLSPLLPFIQNMCPL